MTSQPDYQTDFEAWASLAAQLRSMPEDERTTAVQARGLATHDWTRIHESWAGQLNEDIANGRMERPGRYAELCREAMAQRSSEISAVSAKAPAPSSQGAAPAPEPPRPAERKPDPGTDKSSRARKRAHLMNTMELPQTEMPAAEPSQAAPAPRKPQKTLPPQPSAQHVEAPLPLAPPSQAAHSARTSQPSSDFRGDLTGGHQPIPPKAAQLQTEVASYSAAEIVHQYDRGTGWSLEQYAELSAKLEREPERAEALWTERGIAHDDARNEIVEHWKKKLADDPALWARYQRLVAQHRQRG